MKKLKTSRPEITRAYRRLRTIRPWMTGFATARALALLGLMGRSPGIS
jgi:hypothetical protein